MLSDSLNTTTLPPPTNEVADSFSGIGTIVQVSSSAPAVSISPRCHGPENMAGCVPATNAGVMSKPAGTSLGLRPSSKKLS
jgi:hypothetical protein